MLSKSLSVAEKEGFEPSVRCNPYTGLANRQHIIYNGAEMSENADKTLLSAERITASDAPEEPVCNGSKVAHPRPVENPRKRRRMERIGRKSHYAANWDDAIGVPASLEHPGRFKATVTKHGAFGGRGWSPGYTKQIRVYFIREPLSGAIKVGIALDVLARFTALQASHPYPLQLIGVCPGGAGLEAAIHELFATDRLLGEWFRPTPELRHCIKRVCQPTFNWQAVVDPPAQDEAG